MNQVSLFDVGTEMMDMEMIKQKSTIVRTLGLYQPYAALMLPPYYKVETRWVRSDRQAPFPFGWYLFYSTKKAATKEQILEWSGEGFKQAISRCKDENDAFSKNGFALGVGLLSCVAAQMKKENETESFVLAKGIEYRKNNQTYTQRLLYFSHQRRIEPFEFEFGKQGIGILPESEKKKIKFI